VDRGHAFPGVEICRMKNTFPRLLIAQGRHVLAHQVKGGIMNEQPRRFFSKSRKGDFASGRTLGIAVDAGYFESQGIGKAPLTGCVRDQHRMIAAYFIQVLFGEKGQGKAFDSPGHDPLPLGQILRFAGQRREHVLFRVHPLKLHPALRFPEAEGRQMGVGVDQSRRERLSQEIDDLCFMADITGDLLRVPRIENSAALDGKRLNDGVLPIDGNDFSVFQHQIGGGLRRLNLRNTGKEGGAGNNGGDLNELSSADGPGVRIRRHTHGSFTGSTNSRFSEV